MAHSLPLRLLALAPTLLLAQSDPPPAPPAAPPAPPPSLGWVQLNRPLPGFELTSLDGRPWTLAGLRGKTLFIHLWAVWCAPCREELPHFQKLYEQTKGRADLAVFSLNIDDNLGSIEPFLKAYGYTFPTLPAKPYASKTAASLTIPQNWVVDSRGIWRWQQSGFDGSARDWVATALARIASVQ